MMKKKKFIILISILFIIVIALVITLKELNSKRQAEEELQAQLAEREEKTDDAVKEYFSDKIIPQGMATLYGQYNGSNDINDLYRSLYKFVHYLEEFYDEIVKLDDSGLKEYYTNNWWDIKKTFGIIDKEEFLGFVKYLKSAGFDNDKYDYCKIDKTSYKQENNYLTFNISFSYEGKEELLNFKTYFAYKKGVVPELKFESIR